MDRESLAEVRRRFAEKIAKRQKVSEPNESCWMHCDGFCLSRLDPK